MNSKGLACARARLGMIPHGTSSRMSSTNRVCTRLVRKRFVVEQPQMERNGGLDSYYLHLTERPVHAGNRLVTVIPPGNNFREQGVIVRWDLVAAERVRIHADASGLQGHENGTPTRGMA